MNFQLEHIIADPLIEQNISGSEIWHHEVAFAHGKFIQVKAPSGKGKSTLIQMLYGNRKDYQGKVLLDGQDIRSFNRKKWAKFRQRHLSIVFQELMVFYDLTGWENIMLKLRLTDHYQKDRIDEMAGFMGMTHLLNKKCGHMSFGERQRIALIRSLVQPFDWLLLDEPFSHLDLENTRLGCELIEEECKKRNAGLILTSLDGGDFIHYDQSFIL